MHVSYFIAIFATYFLIDNNMNNRDLNNKLKEDAKRIGINDEVYQKWNEDSSIDDLMKLYKENLDFCISHKWPSKGFIKHHFDQTTLRNYGILIDDTMIYPYRNQKRRFVYIKDYVLMGKSEAIIKYAFKPHACRIHVMEGSSVFVDVKYGAFMEIHLYGNSYANVTTDLVSMVKVVRHSFDAKIRKQGVVKTEDAFVYLK